MQCGSGVLGPGVELALALPGDPQTVQRAELFAVLVALLHCEAGSAPVIVSDSAYAVDWMEGARASYDDTVPLSGVVNGDLLALLARAASGLDVTMLKARAHTGGDDPVSRGNARADELARTGAERPRDHRTPQTWVEGAGLRALPPGELLLEPLRLRGERLLEVPDLTYGRTCRACGLRCESLAARARHTAQEHPRLQVCRPFALADMPRPTQAEGPPLPEQPPALAPPRPPPVPQGRLLWTRLVSEAGTPEALGRLELDTARLGARLGDGPWADHEAALREVITAIQQTTGVRETRHPAGPRWHGARRRELDEARRRVRELRRLRRDPSLTREDFLREARARARARRRAARRRELRRIREVWEEDPRRALDLLTAGERPRCRIPVAILGQALELAAAPVEARGPRPAWLDAALPGPLPARLAEALGDPVTPEEVLAMLRRPATAAGPDGVTYAMWLRVPGAAALLARAYSRWLAEGRVPAQAVASGTVFLYKRGDVGRVESWRPIALQATVGKVFAGVLQTRLRAALVAGGSLSALQKGFLPVDGCFEHAQGLRMALAEAARERRSVYGVFVDFANAFGTVSHALLWETLGALRVPAAFLAAVRAYYAAAYTCAWCGRERSRWVRVRRGVLQGCPLSPLLFCLALDPLLRGLEQLGAGYATHARLDAPAVVCPGSAFADDLVVLGASQEGLAAAFGRVAEFTAYAGMALNAAKCRAFGVLRSHARGAARDDPQLAWQGQAVPTLGPEDTQDYLGVSFAPGSRRPRRSHRWRERADALDEAVHDVARSRLYGTQKLAALNRFLLPRLGYSLGLGEGTQREARRLDARVREVLRRAFFLPQGAPRGVLYAGWGAGGLGLTCLAVERDIRRVVAWVRLLSSPDPRVQGLAWREVAAAQRMAKVVRVAGAAACWNSARAPHFLDWATRRDGTILREGETQGAGDELPALLRALAHLGAAIKLGAGPREPAECWLGGRRLEPALVSRALRQRWREREAGEWAQGPGGGGVAYSLAAPTGYWWRGGPRALAGLEGIVPFILKARTNTLYTGANEQAWYGRGGACPLCGELETLRHALGRCRENGEVRARHNEVVRCLARRLPGCRVEYTPPGQADGARLRPDITLPDAEGRPRVYIDVTIASEEAGYDRLAQRRADKQALYGALPGVGAGAVVWPVVLSTLGTPHPTLYRECRALLGLNSRGAADLVREMGRTAVEGSHRVWGFRCARSHTLAD